MTIPWDAFDFDGGGSYWEAHCSNELNVYTPTGELVLNRKQDKTNEKYKFRPVYYKGNLFFSPPSPYSPYSYGYTLQIDTDTMEITDKIISEKNVCLSV